MRAAAALLALLALPPMTAFAHPPIEPGISRELAQWRAQHYLNVRYALRLRLAEREDRVRGSLAIRVTLPARAPDLVLDWRGAPVRALRVNGKPGEAAAASEHLVIDRRQLKGGVNRIELEFEAPLALSGSALTRYRDREDGSEYVYSLFVPADASSVFPCFDQPDLKARFTLELELPQTWLAVSNAPALEEAPGRARFAETEPIATYLFAFAAGPFERLTVPGEATRLFVRRSRLARATEHAAEVLRLNREALGYFERYFGRRFPFAKYDLVLLPELPYGGMEHAGATFLNEERVLFPAAPSAVDLLRRAQLVFHETSHQWFGDLVTMRWFDDLWLKEGFANFMAAKATEALAPEFDARVAFHATKIAALRTDATPGTTPIRYRLANLAAAKSAYGAIVYSKGPAVLRQAEFYLGEAVFRRAVRDFVRRHAYRAADWRDLVGAFERASGRRLARWASAWVERRGMPTVRARWTLDRAARLRELRLEQHGTLDGGGVWPMRLSVFAEGAGGERRTARVLLRSSSVAVPGLRGLKEPLLVYPNAGDHGYGRFLLDPRSAESALAPERPGADALLEAQLGEALWEQVRDAALEPGRFISYALRRLPLTADDIALAGLLARIEVAFRRYASDAQRDRLAPALERALLADGALAAGSVSRRLLLVRAHAALAWSDAGLADLERLLDGSLEVAGVKLASRDRFRILERLLLRGRTGASARLAAQAAADRTDDGRRYAWAAGASDPRAKRVLFRSFFEDRTLPESWIDAALEPLNAPEHAGLTLSFLEEALARLPELERSRKIFFVGRWLAAFVGGQTGPEALARVRAFLRQADLDEHLRLKVLEAADGLERAVRIRQRYAGG
jgi:aminopeptidase N